MTAKLLHPGVVTLALCLFAGAYPRDASAAEIAGMLHPRLSPDGSRIAVSLQGAISTVPAAGGELRRLSRGEGWDIEPTWSPDGKRIAFLRSNHFNYGQLLFLDAASGEISPPTRSSGATGKLWFSPDGRRLLGRFNLGGSQLRIAWLDLEDGTLETLPIGPQDRGRYQRKGIRYAPSPDGNVVYYTLHRDEPDEQTGNRGPDCEVWRHTAGDDEGEKLFTWPARVYDLAADPHGESLVVVTDLGTAHNELWRLPLDEPLAGAVRITSDLADDDRPSLDEAGSVLVWTNNAGGGTVLRSLDTNSGGIREVRATSVDFGESTGRLSLEFREKVDTPDGSEGGGDGPLTVRVSIRREGGKHHFPTRDALYRILNADGHFYAEGEASLELPAGDYVIRAFRGMEYLVSERTVSVREGAETVERIAMQRWTRQKSEGWYSGENHVHANYGYGEWYNTPATVLRQCAGEDLNLCNAVIANSDGEAVFDREFFLGQVDPRSRDENLVFFGQEFRSTIWGHLTFSNITALVEPIMTGFPGTTNPWDVPTNADVAQLATERNGVVAYTHPSANLLDLYNQPYAAKGLPVDAALGRVALMDVHGATYERGSLALWYRLMNCGLDIVGSSGTDVFLNRVRSLPPGWARTYVHLPDGFGYRRWIDGQVEGRSFFTSGPMLRFTVNGEGMGGRIEMEEAGPVVVEAEVTSATPLLRAELVHNGDVVRTLELAGDGSSAAISGEVEIPASGWLALRAVGATHPDAVRGEPTAHTNPVRITIPGLPNPKIPREAAYFLQWIDRLEADLAERDRIPTERLREHVAAQMEAARRFYRERL